MSNVKYLTAGAQEEGQRLDNYLLRQLKGVPKSHIYRIIRQGEVRVNKKRARASSRLCPGDSIRIPPIRTTVQTIVEVGEQFAENLKNTILYEDKQLMVINKPAGMAVHGGSGLSLGVIEAMRQIRTDLPYLELAHRLDKGTSGCLILAKKRSTLRSIQEQLTQRSIKKTYWAILLGSWHGKQQMLVDVCLKKNILKSGERHVIVHQDGKSSQTAFKLMENFQEACWMEIYPQTGRTHQIRVHSAYLNHPVFGDQKYGGDISIDSGCGIKTRLYLHARAIQFTLDDTPYVFKADVDDAFHHALAQLRKRRC